LAGPVQTASAPPASERAKPVRIGVARDAAFCFCYPENLELLERAGAELVCFSPLTDALPEHLSGLYLPGGYPELYGERLMANAGLLAALRRAAQAGLPVYAECGGLLYLSQGIATRVGAQHAAPLLAGLFPTRARMLTRRKAIGYREVTFITATPLGPAGTVARGHEFHYSELAMPEDVPRSYRVVDRAGRPCPREGYLCGNVLGSYIHLHFASNPQLAEHFVSSCRQWRQAAR
jgi:cobyrinic acid a,c-diamide synthase